MKALDLAILFEADSRAAALDNPAPDGKQKALDHRPFDGPGHRIGEDDGEGLALLAVHQSRIELLAIFASTFAHKWYAPLSIRNLRIAGWTEKRPVSRSGFMCSSPLVRGERHSGLVPECLVSTHKPTSLLRSLFHGQIARAWG